MSKLIASASKIGLNGISMTKMPTPRILQPSLYSICGFMKVTQFEQLVYG